MTEKLTNPFVLNRPLEVVCIKPHSEEDDNLYTESNKFYIERQRKINVYYDNHSNIDEMLYGNLTSKGRDLFLYIQYHIPENKDYISLKLDDVRRKTGISKNALVTALQSLKANGIITPKSQSIYWVNPFYFFHGNRIKYFKELGDTYLKVVSVIKK